jgi:hypothetical protein
VGWREREKEKRGRRASRAGLRGEGERFGFFFKTFSSFQTPFKKINSFQTSKHYKLFQNFESFKKLLKLHTNTHKHHANKNDAQALVASNIIQK